MAALRLVQRQEHDLNFYLRSKSENNYVTFFLASSRFVFVWEIKPAGNFCVEKLQASNSTRHALARLCMCLYTNYPRTLTDSYC